ncbi:MAG: nucleotidyltransferase domain-containing protein [Chloroflexi bacterium]|nr:nucleotidyltransferase domain-containing protein [Chloroflexota bacterium]
MVTGHRSRQALPGILAALRGRLSELRQRYGVRSLGVFGSYVRGEQRRGSDVDILVEFEQEARPSLLGLAALQTELDAALGLTVDLVDVSGYSLAGHGTDARPASPRLLRGRHGAPLAGGRGVHPSPRARRPPGVAGRGASRRVRGIVETPAFLTEGSRLVDYRDPKARTSAVGGGKEFQLASILYMGTHGTDDPTRASMPFIGANGAIQAGHRASIGLLIDAVLLMKDSIAESIVPVGFPPLKEHLATAIQNQIPIYV